MSYNEFLKLLEHEMLPALGCTDPIGIAFCAAAAAKHVQGELERVDAFFSMNLLKNAAAVTIPNTNGLCGARIATAAGIFGGNAEKGLEALRDLTPMQLNAAIALEQSDKLEVSIADNDKKLYMKVTITSSVNTVTAIVQDAYTNLTNLLINGVEQIPQRTDSAPASDDNRYDLLSINSIYDFAANVPFEKLSHIEQALKLNIALAEKGMKGFPGSEVAKLMYESCPAESKSISDQAVLWSLSGVDARMAGCPLPAMSNTGSGNQGIVCTLPVYGASLALDSGYKQLVRATALSCLITIYIKHKLGNLSAGCGCTIASAGAGCGIAFLRGGKQETMVRVLKNMLGNLAGLLCDGAKTSCALKTAACVSAACLASDLALKGFALPYSNGIVGKEETDTIDNFVRISNEGLSGMDPVVLDIIMSKEL